MDSLKDNRRRNNKKLIEKIEITNIGARGKGVGKHPDGKNVFIPYTAPGDVLDAYIVKKRKKYVEGIPLRFYRYSDWRTEALCPHYGICGGCQLQHITYDKQLKVKENEVLNNLQRIGNLEWEHTEPILASPRTEHYRNKMEYAFTDSRWLTAEQIRSGENFDRRGLGFHVPGHWDKILDVEFCALQAEPGNRIRNALRDFAKENNLEFFSPRQRKGFLRQLTLRITRSGQIMVLVHFFRRDDRKIALVMNFLKENFPEITSLLYVVNPKPNDTIYDLEVEHWAGTPYIIETLAGLQFRIKPKSFFQTNSYQTENLYRLVKEYAAIEPNHVVYDLYSGTGSIALFVADRAAKVVGIETLPQAVEDARYNARLNKIDNVEFMAGDAKDLFSDELIETYGRPHILIVDPPREGMHERVVKQILKLLPERIVYVSCHSATQARDLARMKNFYELRLVRPVDMFPHTHHVENIALLERKKAVHA